jgi:hypothetical protein
MDGGFTAFELRPRDIAAGHALDGETSVEDQDDGGAFAGVSSATRGNRSPQASVAWNASPGPASVRKSVPATPPAPLNRPNRLWWMLVALALALATVALIAAFVAIAKANNASSSCASCDGSGAPSTGASSGGDEAFATLQQDVKALQTENTALKQTLAARACVLLCVPSWVEGRRGPFVVLILLLFGSTYYPGKCGACAQRHSAYGAGAITGRICDWQHDVCFWRHGFSG